MLGAISGDVIGSVYEVNNVKNKNFDFFVKGTRFTDDSVMTCAIANACVDYLNTSDIDTFRESCIRNMRCLGLSHINAGYGGTFIHWLVAKNPHPYNSFGNGSAMRVSPVAYVADNLKDAETLAEISASVTHNHPYGINGAKAVAGCIWLLLSGKNKDDIKNYVENNYYSLNFTLNEIRKSYKFDVTCQGSVPQAIVSFLEGNSFEDTLRNAISIGGDSDTIAAISCSLAEAYYGVPDEIKKRVLNYLDKDLLNSVETFYRVIYEDNLKLKKQR